MERLSKEILVEKQHASHGLAWIATYRAALKEMVNWALNLEEQNNFQEMEQLILQFAFSEYCSQVKSGIPMSQMEFIRPQDLGLKNGLFNEIGNDDFEDLIINGNNSEDRMKLAHLLRDGFSSKNFGNLGIDETSMLIREQFRKFVEEDVSSQAHEWHLKDDLIPMSSY